MHAAVEARESEKAAVFGSTLQRKCPNNTIPHINQVHPILNNDEMNEITKH